MKNLYPSAQQVAQAIVAASRLMGVDPVKVLRNIRPKSRELYDRQARARYYAARALSGRFLCSGSAIARLVGSQSPSVFMTNLSQRLAAGRFRWWNEDVLAKVAAAIGGGDDAKADDLDCRDLPDPVAAGLLDGIDGGTGDAGASSDEGSPLAALCLDGDPEGVPSESGLIESDSLAKALCPRERVILR